MKLQNGKLVISHKDNLRVIILGIIIYVISRLILAGITYTFGLEPFLSYDDKVLYNQVRISDNINYLHYMRQRQIFYIICALLNQIRIGALTGPRIFNLCVYFLMCIEIRKLCMYMGYAEKTSNFIFYTFLFIPYYLFYGSSLYKDIAVAFCVIKLLNLYMEYKMDNKLHLIKIVVVAFFLYFFRFGVLESLVLLLLFNYLITTSSKLKYFVIAIIILGVIYFLVNNYMYWYVFEQKMDAYVKRSVVETGFLGRIRITHISHFSDLFINMIKLVLLFLYTQMHPWPGAVLAILQGHSWAGIIGCFSIVQVFMIPFFWYYVIRVKKNIYEKNVLFFYLVWEVILMIISPELSRFFYFITPIFFLFAIKTFYEKKGKFLVLFGCCFSFSYILLNLFR